MKQKWETKIGSDTWARLLGNPPLNYRDKTDYRRVRDDYPVYVASRASVPERPAMWRRLRDEKGWKITSSWIDEAKIGQTRDWEDLWVRIETEIRRSAALLLYAEPNDFPLKGALVEVGMAIGMGKWVIFCCPGVNLDSFHRFSPIGTWIRHPKVFYSHNIEAAYETLQVYESVG